MLVSNKEELNHIYSIPLRATPLWLKSSCVGIERWRDPNGIDEYEAQYFDNLGVRQLDQSNSCSGQYAAHTHVGEPVGPTTTLRVKANDGINLEVFVKEGGTSNQSPSPFGLGDLLEQSANDAVVAVEGGALSNAVGSSIASILAGVTTSSTEAKAYLQYILFDEGFNVVATDYMPLEGGETLTNGWKKLTLGNTVTQDGYLYAYVVNESDKDVYFDDFTFQLLGNRAIRKTDYYPFGAVAKQWSNPDQTQQEKYRHGYQGQYAERDSTTGWEAFQLRMYDPLIGRFLQVDPERQYASSYMAMGNNPLKLVDPTGGMAGPGDPPTSLGVRTGPCQCTVIDKGAGLVWEAATNQDDFFREVGSENDIYGNIYNLDDYIESRFTFNSGDMADQNGGIILFSSDKVGGGDIGAVANFADAVEDLSFKIPGAGGVGNVVEMFSNWLDAANSLGDGINSMRDEVVLTLNAPPQVRRELIRHDTVHNPKEFVIPGIYQFYKVDSIKSIYSDGSEEVFTQRLFLGDDYHH